MNLIKLRYSTLELKFTKELPCLTCRGLEKISEYRPKYCEIDAKYSIEKRKMVPLKPTDPDDLEFFTEAMNHLKNYKELLKYWESLKQETSRLNNELAILFEEIRLRLLKEISIPYWCSGYSGDEPDEYLCPDHFVRSIYDEITGRMETGRSKYYGNGTIGPSVHGDKTFFFLSHGNNKIARSQNQVLMKKTQKLFREFIEDVTFRKRIEAFVDKQKSSYVEKLEKVKGGIGNIIKSIELGNIIQGKCRYCP